MGNDVEVSAVLGLLGRIGEHPTAVRRHRRVLVTTHRLRRGAAVDWRRQESRGASVAGLMFADVALELGRRHCVSRAETGEALFLHPEWAVRAVAEREGAALCIWLPWDAIREVDDGTQRPGRVMSATPLTAGLRAFASALTTPQDSPTLYTDYLVERLVVEMAFGVVLESVPTRVAVARDAHPVDRARTVMLMRRAEPGFGVAELAEELHLSARQVQRAFSAVGTTPAAELRGMRIELANELLGDPSCDRLGLAEIAAHSGFRNAAALRRAFAGRNLPVPTRTQRVPAVSP